MRQGWHGNRRHRSTKLCEGPVVFRSGPRQLALFQAGDETHAIDNRCPPEGYPLAQGTVDESCVLTCNGHNWKFNLDDGRCLLGRDHGRRDFADD